MISICIPIFNCDVRQLVHSLNSQADELAIEYEILLIDDGSDNPIKEKNRELTDLLRVKYKELPQNTGRSAIRNTLAREAIYKYLVFMDCDAEICNNDYVRRYAVCCAPGIVCFGGCKYHPITPDSPFYLRWLFGVNREDIDVHIREEHPNSSFRTFNFLIDRDIMLSTKFDERLRGYGHEDTLFGIELLKKDIEIIHIDNPLIHLGLENAGVFILRSEESIRNLIEIQKLFDKDGTFTNSVKILRTERKISKLHLTTLIALAFKYSRKYLLKNLEGKHPKLLFFDLYRLGYLCSLRNVK